MLDPQFWVNLAILVPIFIASIALHELAHAVVADSLGDPTARMAGRITANPLAHLDFFGTMMILIAGFGWAKPVPVRTDLLRWPRLGSFLVSAAGPLTNVALALLALWPLKYAGLVGGSHDWLATAFQLNITLAVLNLIPLPPLDGGHLLEALVPRRWLPAYEHLVPYGMVLLVILVMGPWNPLGPLFHSAARFVYGLV